MSQKDIKTANKIKDAASMLFTAKGFGRTTTREIAAEAGVNLALVNYYFKSKDELFQSIMMEAIQGFLAQLTILLNDDHDFEEKLNLVVSNYIDLLLEKPELPIFMMSEIRNNPSALAEKLHIHNLFSKAQFFQDLAKRCPDNVSPTHIFMNILSMTVFPFMTQPLIKTAMNLEDEQFKIVMNQRRKLIPLWILSMLKPTIS